MIKKLFKQGDNYLLEFDLALLNLMEIEPDTPLNIAVDGQVLIITPATDAKHIEEFENALELINRKYKKTLKKLAE